MDEGKQLLALRYDCRELMNYAILPRIHSDIYNLVDSAKE